ncbi:MAG: hypothetical protein CL610_00085 [Anaerolineaceae bacterium]|nr:hypothetical protein [Anaerolineaceae bacterium]
MTLQEILEALDELSWEEMEALQQHLDQRRSGHQRDLMTEAAVRRQIDDILKDAEPVELVAGTMDVEKLMRGIDAMREGLTQEELEEIADAMNEEYIEVDDWIDE